MKQRSAADGETFHAGVGVRVYEGDWTHGNRIQKARKMVETALNNDFGTVVELGCGTADICGYFSEWAAVYGYDCNSEALIKAKERFPGIAHLGKIPEKPQRSDVLILCEFLEHIEDPIELVLNWLPMAENCVISHPLDESLDSALSAGEHQWSYCEADFDSWFAIGGHDLVEKEKFQMEGYTIIMGRGKRKE